MSVILLILFLLFHHAFTLKELVSHYQSVSSSSLMCTQSNHLINLISQSLVNQTLHDTAMLLSFQNKSFFEDQFFDDCFFCLNFVF